MVRQAVRQVGTVKKRQYAKYAIDVQRENDCLAMLGIFVFLRHRMTNAVQRRRYFFVMCMFAAEVEQIQQIPVIVMDKVERRYLRYLDASLKDEFTINFRFRRDHFPSVLRCLRIPVYFKLDNGSICNGEEGLLIFLKIFSFPERLVTAEVFTGWESSRLSRIFNWVSWFIYVNHKHLLENNLDWHAKYLELSLQALQAKKRHYHPQGLLNPRTVDVAENYDGLRDAINRPQGRYDGNGVWLDIQANVYSGHVKVSFVVQVTFKISTSCIVTRCITFCLSKA
jgi:hypothetical protein